MQVPFFFKTIVDSMNVDFLAMGGTVWTAAGSVVLACTRPPFPSHLGWAHAQQMASRASAAPFFRSCAMQFL